MGEITIRVSHSLAWQLGNWIQRCPPMLDRTQIFSGATYTDAHWILAKINAIQMMMLVRAAHIKDTLGVMIVKTSRSHRTARFQKVRF